MTDLIFRLTQMHRSLDEAIRQEGRTRRPDPWRLLRLKKLRLMVKDRLARGAPMRGPMRLRTA